MIDNIHQVLAFGMPGTWEWFIILIVALLIFGRRLPEIARGLGKSLTEFKKGIHEAEDSKDEFVNDVKKVGDDVAKESKEAAGLNENNNKH